MSNILRVDDQELNAAKSCAAEAAYRLGSRYMDNGDQESIFIKDYSGQMGSESTSFAMEEEALFLGECFAPRCIVV